MSGSEKLVDTSKLKNKKVSIIGIGGLGCTAALLLSRQGLNLTLIDGDIIEESNLERQILFTKNDLSKPKVEIAKEKIKGFSSVETIFDTITEKNVNLLENSDIILDCTDNMETRQIIDNFCKDKKIPWIYSGGVAEIGSLYFIDYKNEKRATFSDLFDGKKGESACSIGVINTTVSIIGAFAAKMVVDFLAKSTYPKELIRINFENIEIQKIKVDKK